MIPDIDLRIATGLVLPLPVLRWTIGKFCMGNARHELMALGVDVEPAANIPMALVFGFMVLETRDEMLADEFTIGFREALLEGVDGKAPVCQLKVIIAACSFGPVLPERNAVRGLARQALRNALEKASLIPVRLRSSKRT